MRGDVTITDVTHDLELHIHLSPSEQDALIEVARILDGQKPGAPDSYCDDSYPSRTCDRCGREYRGPAV